VLLFCSKPHMPRPDRDSASGPSDREVRPYPGILESRRRTDQPRLCNSLIRVEMLAHSHAGDGRTTYTSRTLFLASRSAAID
jgi:hypothetical protein